MSRSDAAMYALLTDGTTVEIRPARAQDAEAVRAMHAAMSPDNIYLRFFSMSSGVAEREASRVCREPDSDHEALLAWQGDRLVGVAAYEPAGKPGVAEAIRSARRMSCADLGESRGVARRAPRVPSEAERGADAGPAAPRSGAALNEYL